MILSLKKIHNHPKQAVSLIGMKILDDYRFTLDSIRPADYCYWVFDPPYKDAPLLDLTLYDEATQSRHRFQLPRRTLERCR